MQTLAINYNKQSASYDFARSFLSLGAFPLFNSKYSYSPAALTGSIKASRRPLIPKTGDRKCWFDFNPIASFSLNKFN